MNTAERNAMRAASCASGSNPSKLSIETPESITLIEHQDQPVVEHLVEHVVEHVEREQVQDKAPSVCKSSRPTQERRNASLDVTPTGRDGTSRAKIAFDTPATEERFATSHSGASAVPMLPKSNSEPALVPQRKNLD
jgi:hypothetical protein